MAEFADASEDWVDDDSMLTMMQGVEESQQEEEATVVDSQQARVSLCPEQQLVVDLVRKGNVSASDRTLCEKLGQLYTTLN